MTAININISNVFNQLLLQLSLSKLNNIICLCTVVMYCDPPAVCVCVRVCVLSNRPPYRTTLHMTGLNELGFLSDKVTQGE